MLARGFSRLTHSPSFTSRDSGETTRSPFSGLVALVMKAPPEIAENADSSLFTQRSRTCIGSPHGPGRTEHRIRTPR